MPDQLRVTGLAMRLYWIKFGDTLRPLADQCKDLALSYVPNLWSQYDEGLVYPSEFFSKLIDVLGSNSAPPLNKLAAIELAERAAASAHQQSDFRK